MRCRLALLTIAASWSGLVECAKAGNAEYVDRKSFFTQIDNSTWVIGNEIWNVTQGRQYAKKLYYQGKDLVGNAWGHYVSYNGAASDLNWTSAAISSEGPDFIDVAFTAREGSFHWVIRDGLAGAHQYFINAALPTLGEFRTLWRLDNTSFTHGKTDWRDDKLPALSEYAAAENVQDETWMKNDGSFLTKYDWAAFLRLNPVWGVYGEGVGSWYVHPGMEYFNGDQLKQELMVHRESRTGDTVALNMLHGTHFQAVSSDVFPIGRTWGPWLWYLNDGSFDDANERLNTERAAWPYSWFNNTAFQSRGSVTGTLDLSDGRLGTGAYVFLGDNNSNKSTLDQGKAYYYTALSNGIGDFRFTNVRAGTYAVYAWSAGGTLADVYTRVVKNDVVVKKGEATNLGSLEWKVTKEEDFIWRVGDFDRLSEGFNMSRVTDAPFGHGKVALCPANVTFTVGESGERDWCFGQSVQGTHTILFSLSEIRQEAKKTKLHVSLAGFSSGTTADILVNGNKVGSIGPGLMSSQDTYRGAIRAGEWWPLEYSVATSTLKVGENRLEFKVGSSSRRWSGWLWDAVSLEWVM